MTGQLAGLFTGQQATQSSDLAAAQAVNGVQARPGQPTTPGEAPLTGTVPAIPAGPSGANGAPGGGPGAGPGGNAPGMVSTGPSATPTQAGQQVATGPAGTVSDPALSLNGPRGPPPTAATALGNSHPGQPDTPGEAGVAVTRPGQLDAGAPEQQSVFSGIVSFLQDSFNYSDNNTDGLFNLCDVQIHPLRLTRADPGPPHEVDDDGPLYKAYAAQPGR